MAKHLKQVLEWSKRFKCLISETPTVDIPKEQKDIRIKLLLEEVDELRFALQENDLVEAC